MDIRPIKSEGDYKRALSAIEQLWQAKPDTRESDRLELLSILVEAFEREHYPIPPPDPISAIEHCMESRGLARKDLNDSSPEYAKLAVFALCKYKEIPSTQGN